MRSKNIKKWLVTLSLGLVSACTCCCFCGGFGGNIVVPFDDDDEDKEDDVIKWMNMGIVSIKCIPFCGLCLGCCGEFGPGECL